MQKGPHLRHKTAKPARACRGPGLRLWLWTMACATSSHHSRRKRLVARDSRARSCARMPLTCGSMCVSVVERDKRDVPADRCYGAARKQATLRAAPCRVVWSMRSGCCAPKRALGLGRAVGGPTAETKRGGVGGAHHEDGAENLVREREQFALRLVVALPLGQCYGPASCSRRRDLGARGERE